MALVIGSAMTVVIGCSGEPDKPDCRHVCDAEEKRQNSKSVERTVSEWNLDQAHAEALQLDATVHVDDEVLQFSRRVGAAKQALNSATASVRATAKTTLEDLKKEQIHWLEHFDAQRDALAKALP